MASRLGCVLGWEIVNCLGVERELHGESWGSFQVASSLALGVAPAKFHGGKLQTKWQPRGACSPVQGPKQNPTSWQELPWSVWGRGPFWLPTQPSLSLRAPVGPVETPKQENSPRSGLPNTASESVI